MKDQGQVTDATLDKATLNELPSKKLVVPDVREGVTHLRTVCSIGRPQEIVRGCHGRE